MEMGPIDLKGITQYSRSVTVNVRVLRKGPINNIGNDKKVLSIDVVDCRGTWRSVKSFGNSSDPPLRGARGFEEGDIVVITNVVLSSKCKVELILRDGGTVEPVTGPILEKFKAVIPHQPWEPTNGWALIGDLLETKPSMFNVIGVISAEPEPASTFTSKKGRELTKRVFTISDQSRKHMECTLWGNACHIDAEKGDFLLLLGAQLSEFGGNVSINGSFVSYATILPKMEVVNVALQGNPGSEHLKPRLTWLQTMDGVKVDVLGKGAGVSSSLFRTCDLLEMIEAFRTGFEGLCICYVVIGRVQLLQERPPFYEACIESVSGRMCSKRATLEGDEEYVCATGHRNSRSQNRWILRLWVADELKDVSVTFFEDDVVRIFGVDGSAGNRMFREEYENLELKLDSMRGVYAKLMFGSREYEGERQPSCRKAFLVEPGDRVINDITARIKAAPVAA